MLKPLSNRVIVKLIAEPEKTEGGIYIPKNAKESQFRKAKVLAVGPGLPDQPMEVKVGDTVLLLKILGKEIKSEGTHIVREDDIMAVLDES